jgi:Domain of unknown function (DUF4349)
MTSADIVRELQGARPVASDALRLRIRTLEPTPAHSPGGFLTRLRMPKQPRRRGLVIVIPAAALLAVAAAGITGALEGGSPTEQLEAGRTAKTSAPPGEDASTTGADRDALAESATAQATLAPGATAPSPATTRAERYAAQLTLEVADPDAVSAATQQALKITRDLGGYIVSAQVASGETGYGSLTLRVPHARAQEAITRLTQLGTIIAQNVQVEDLQSSLDALTKRITQLRTQLAAIDARLLAGDLDSVERAQLQARRGVLREELSTATRGKTAVNAEAQNATISLELRTPEGSNVVPVPSGFDRAIDRALEILAWEAVAVAFTALVLGPLGLLALLAWAGRRTSRRRAEARVLGA